MLQAMYNLIVQAGATTNKDEHLSLLSDTEPRSDALKQQPQPLEDMGNEVSKTQ